MTDVTHILSAVEAGDPRAAGQLLPLVYGELRRLAARKLAHAQPGIALQATAPVHRAYLRWVDVSQARQWNSRRARAAALPRRAFARGDKDVARMKQDTGPVIPRAREDFTKLLAEPAATQKPR